MVLKKLKLRCYRNLADMELNWNEHFNIIFGKNAQGKTNLLEAIYLLGHLKSFRGARGREVISHTSDNAWIGGQVNKRGVEHKLEIGLQKNGRNPRVDGKTVQRLSQFLGYVRAVLFTPEELGNIKGFPAGRRALLDRAILQTEPVYLDLVQEYERILKQRNRLLKQVAKDEELVPWTQAIIKTGSRIRYERINYLERFRPHLEKVYREITGGRETASLHYTVEKQSQEQLGEHLQQAFVRLASREKKLGMTLAGPHRDDLDFMVDDYSLRSFGSQGQQRSLLLAFKAAQVMDLEEQLNEPPLLLLDDLASELDSSRQEGFFNFLLQRRGQVYLTSAHRPQLGGEVEKTASYYQVDQGMVSPISS